MFTTENAAEMGRKGAEAAVAARRQQMIAVAEAMAADQMMATFEGRTLARVRLQLDKVFEAFVIEADKSNSDASKLDRLASAQARLSEQERILSGRPMPGSLRPTTKATKPRISDMESPEPASSVIHTPTNSVPVQPVEAQTIPDSQAIDPEPIPDVPPVV